MPDVVDDADRLDVLLDRQERRIATIFRTAIANLKGQIDLGELADLLAQGRVNDALERLQHAAELLGNASTVAFVTSGQSTAQFLTNAAVGQIVFDQVNTVAVAQMQSNRLELVREFTSEQRRAVSVALVTGVEGGTNPIAQARNFRDSVGLTTRQWQAVARYRQVLEQAHTDPEAASNALARALRDGRTDGQVRRAVRDAKPIPKERVDHMVERYAARYVKHRAEVIGRTEALRAVHQGNEESYRQAIEAGTIDAASLRRKWVTRIDKRERRTHHDLNGQERGWGEPWTTPNGLLRYPGDPDAPGEETIQCRCAIATRIKQR